LDIDYHEETQSPRNRLDAIVERIKPTPFSYHPTHTGGYKLYYVGKPGYSADELASAGALEYLTLATFAGYPPSGIDLIKSSRHPCFPRSRDGASAPCTQDGIHYTYGSGDLSSLRRLIAGEVSAEDVDEWLEEQGLTRGMELPHSRCWIDPTDDDKRNVFVGDIGITCMRCQAKGLGANGFVPYSALIRSKVDNQLLRMVKHFVHYSHAGIVLENLYPKLQERFRKLVYRCLMKIWHGPEEARVSMAEYAGRGFVRTHGQWVSEDGTTVLAQGLREYVKSLPAVLIPKEKKGYAVNVPAATAFSNSGNLSDYGYDDVTFLRGTRIYSHHNGKGGNNLTRVVHRPEFKHTPPRYLPMRERIPLSSAIHLLESEFPGIDSTYLYLLIASKGVAEGRQTQCPYLLITGPSGSGKSTIPQIAAGICGDKAEEPIFVPQIDRFRQSLMDAARTSSFLVINEVFKTAARFRMTPVQALDPMLSLTEDSRSHVLYVGSVPFGQLPTFVITDIEVPQEVETDVQLSRRFIYHRLTCRNYWSDTFTSRQIRPHEFRLISADHNHAADVILSDVIDKWFQEPTSMQQICKDLKLTTLEQHSEQSDNIKERLLKFYALVCAAPALSGADAERYSTVGWKKVDRNTNDALVESWSDFADGQLPEQWVKSRIMVSEDWGRLIDAPYPIQCEIRPFRGSVVYVRFRSTESAKSPRWVNGKKLSENN
jgi:energy-coupling factor transporter ATP-binding protein EcfA2